MNGKTTRSYGEQLAEQIAYFDRLVSETHERQRGIGCYVARHNRRHPDRPVRFIPENKQTAALPISPYRHWIMFGVPA